MLGYVIASLLFCTEGSLFVMTILGILDVMQVLFKLMFFIFSELMNCLNILILSRFKLAISPLATVSRDFFTFHPC